MAAPAELRSKALSSRVDAFSAVDARCRRFAELSRLTRLSQLSRLSRLERRLSRLSLADNRLEGDLPTALVYHWICNDSLRYLNLSGNPLLLLASYDPSLSPSTMTTLTATTTADVTRGGVGSSSSVSGYGGGGIGSSGSGSGIDGGSGGSGGGKARWWRGFWRAI